MHALLPSRRANGRRRLTASGAIALAAALAVGGLAPVAAVESIPTTTTLEASAATLQTHHPLTLTATVAPTPPDMVAAVVFKDVFNAEDSVLGTVDIVGGIATLEVPTLAVGTHSLTAEYVGDGTYEDSTSLPVEVVVTVDVVEATGVGVSLSKFYPKVDGYKDTVKVRGTRVEPLSVAIAIKNSAGKTVRSASFAKAAGAYAWSWNGKNKAGTLQPAGTYTVVQTLRDGYTAKVVKSTVALSWKKLVWRSFAQTKNLSRAAWETTGGAGWAFAVPAATVYGRLTASVYAKGSGVITVRDATCGGSTWDNSACWTVAYKLFDNGSWGWRTVSRAAGGKFVSAKHVVRIVVAADGLLWVRKADTVKLTLRYAVLR